MVLSVSNENLIGLRRLQHGSVGEADRRRRSASDSNNVSRHLGYALTYITFSEITVIRIGKHENSEKQWLSFCQILDL